MSTHSQQTSVSMVRCTTIYRICNKQYNYPEHWLFTLFHALWAGSPSALWSCTCKPIRQHNVTCNRKLIDKYSTKCNCTIIHNKCTWTCKNNSTLHSKCKKKKTKSIVIPKNLLWCKTQTTAISNRRFSSPFNPKPCNPRAQETGRPLCRPLLCYSQDRTLILRIRLTFQSLSPSRLPCLPAEALTSITGDAMAYGHQHSTIMTTEANSKREDPKRQKIKRKLRKRIFWWWYQRGVRSQMHFEGEPVALQSTLVRLRYDPW